MKLILKNTVSQNTATPHPFTLIVLMCMLSQQSQAITNIEKARITKAEDGWNGNVQLSLSGESGNSEKREIEIGSHIRWTNQNFEWLNWYSRLREEQDGIITDNETYLHTRLIHNHKKALADEYFIQYENAPFDGLKRRLLVGAGLRWHNWNNPKISDETSSGHGYQGFGVFQEKIREIDFDVTSVEKNYRANLYSHWIYQHSGVNAVSTSATLYIQPNVADMDDVKALLQAQLTLPITEKVNLQWQWQSKWDSRPPSGISKKVHEANMQITYSF